MLGGPAKRFYKKADIDEAEGEGFRVLLDGRPVRTPASALLALPSRQLALAIAEEWDAQEEKIEPLSMGLMQLAATAMDRVAGRQGEVIAEIVKFVETDLTCYRADAPEELAIRQSKAWQPELDWFNNAFGVSLAVTSGIMPVAQPENIVPVLGGAMERMSSWQLSALHSLTAGLSSVVLGLSVLHGRLDGETAFAYSRLDELFQAELWGEDKEAKEKRQAVRDDMLTAERFLQLLRGGEA